MRLVSYGPFGAERAGILANEQIFDLEKAMQTAGAEAPVSDMRLFLEQPAWRSALDRAYAARDKVTPVALSTVRLGARFYAPAGIGDVGRRKGVIEDTPHPFRLLRARRERPRSCCAAQCEYEFSPSEVNCHATLPPEVVCMQ